MNLLKLINGYVFGSPMLDIWRRYPDITEAEDEATDTWACDQAAAGFAAYAAERGWSAEVVRAEDAEHPWADYHVWVRLDHDGQPVNVDFTARQYHNLDGVGSAALDAPWPLIWPGTEDAHPMVGRFATVTRTLV